MKSKLLFDNFLNALETKWSFWVAGILLLALILRVWGLGSESAWIDEAYSIVLAKHSPTEIIRGTAADQHPPLYYLLLHIWLWFGESVLYARWLSVIIGLIGVYQAVIFGRKIGGFILGFLSGLFLAISPMHIWYSQEVRMYILLGSLTTASTYFLWTSFQQEKKKMWFLYGLSTLLALYTHYFSVFVVIAQGTWILIRSLRKKQLTPFLHWFVATVIAGIFFLPWVPTALYQSQAHALEWLSSPTLTEVRDVFLRIIFGVSIYGLPNWGRTILIIFVVICFGSIFLVKRVTSRWYYVLLGWLSLIPFTLVALISIFYPIFQYKQFIIILTPLLIWLAWVIKDLQRYWGLLLLATFLVLASASTVYQAISITKDDWQSTTELIQSQFQADDVVFGNPAAISLATSLYEDEPLSPIGYPENYNIITGGWEAEIITEDIADAVLISASQGKKRIWLVEYHPEFWDPEHYVEGWLSDHGDLIYDSYFDRIRVRLYTILGGDSYE